MQIHDDEQFEKYLKQFNPVMPEPLPARERSKPRPRLLFFAAWAAIAAAILLAVTVTVLRHNPDVTNREVGTNAPAIGTQSNIQPLTVSSANALLANAPSFKAAVESLTFQSETKQISPGKQSVLAVLSKENLKL